MKKETNVTLLRAILNYADTQPEKTALKFLTEDYVSYEEINYKDLKARIVSLSNTISLAQQQKNKTMLVQKPILLLFDSSIEYIISFLAVLHSGNIAVTAYPPRHARHLDRLLKIIKNSNAEYILTTSKIKNFCSAEQFVFPEKNSLLCIDKLPNNLSTAEIITIPEDYTALLQYTSGSTGAPKGVVVTHKNILANLDLMAGFLGDETMAKCVSWLPIFHDMGLFGNTLLPLYKGKTCIFMAPYTFLKNPLFWLQTFSQERGTYTMAPNFSYDLAADALKKTDVSNLDLDFSSIRCLINGAEPIKPHTIKNFEKTLKPYGLAKHCVKPGYGMAETTLCISVEMERTRFIKADQKALETGIIKDKDKSDSPVELVSCGFAHNSYLLRIVDPNRFQVKPYNQVGEIWVQGDSVASGYYNNLEKTEEIFNAYTSDTGEGPFLKTGDLGFISQEGKLFICGRVKDLLILNGRNIYPQDIEMACYHSHPALIANSTAAFSVENGSSEECIIIAEVTSGLEKSVYSVILETIRKSVIEHLDIIPKDILLIPPRKILKTSSGKIQRSACKNRYLQKNFEIIARLQQSKEIHPKVNVSENHTDITQWLKQWISEHAKVSIQNINIHKAFSEYGLSSIRLVNMVAELEQFTQQPLDPWIVWEHPNIFSLSQQFVKATNSKELQQEKSYDPIAIVGIDCLLAGKNYQNIRGVDSLWENLQKNQDNLSSIPQDHWDNRMFYDPDRSKKGRMYCTEGGFLSDVKRFDAKFFNISPKEAAYLDPQQRLFLSVTWHALEDAGIVADDIKKSKTGIYLGLSTHDYDGLIQKTVPLDELNAYQATGTSFSTAAGRLAYFLDTQGPCMAIDTACSSSLVSIHQASRSLQNGDCHLAIAGGVNLMLSPEANIIFCKSNMLSPTNRCHTFDKAADGYVRGEGCAIVILKKLSDAIQDKNRIYAIIKGSAVNQDGASNGLTAPNLNAQIDVINTALQLSNLTADQVGHVEAHGTGTPLGDPIEWEGIRRTYGSNRENPLYITSIKTRIGHLEAAAGVAGFIKAVLAVKKGKIPAHLHFKQFNPNIHLQDTMKIPQELQDWDDNKRYAAVSAFGFSGTNAHIILGEPPKPEKLKEEVKRPYHLWTVSAHNKEALTTYLKHYYHYGNLHRSNLHFASQCHHLLTQRMHFPYRAFIVAKNKEEWFTKVKNQDWCESASRDENQMAWLFTGQGCLQSDVALQLHSTLPPFAAIMDHCCALSQQWLPYDVREVLLHTPENIDINDTQYAQPALFIFEYSLAQWLIRIGLKPAVILGHSLGEYVATCIAEILSLEDALMLVCKRALLFSTLTNNGSMLAIEASFSTVKKMIGTYDTLVIALKNSPNQIVVSGTDDAITNCQNECKENQIACKKISTSHAFHSPLIEPIAEAFEKIADTITYNNGKIPLISNVTGLEIEEGQLNASYWRQHMMETVEFHQGLESMMKKGVDICLEIGPKPVLTAQIRETVDVLCLPTISNSNNPWPGLLETIGTLHIRGVTLNWKEYDNHHRFVDEPLLKYPFQEKQYWLPDFTSALRSSSIEQSWKSMLYQEKWNTVNWRPSLIDEKLDGTVVVICQHESPHIHALIAKLTARFPNIKARPLLVLNDNEKIHASIQQADAIIYYCPLVEDTIIKETSLIMPLTQELIATTPEKPFLFISDTNSLAGSALLALLMSVKQEYPEWPLKCMQIASEADDEWLDFLFSAQKEYWAIRYLEDGQYRVKEIDMVEAQNTSDERTISSEEVCLLTGAYGDIGQALIEELFDQGLRYLVAVGRRESEPSWTDAIQEKRKQGLHLYYCSCDVSNPTAVKKLLENLPSDFSALTMIIHAAGTTIDRPWLKTTHQDIETIASAKSDGAWHLHQNTLDRSLKAFICISSLSSVFGNQGQALYSAANAYLNALVELRLRLNRPAQSLMLGPIKNTGLFKKNEHSLTAYFSSKGIAPLSLNDLKYIFKHQMHIPKLIIAHFLKPIDELMLLEQSTDPKKNDNADKKTEMGIIDPEEILRVSQDTLGAAPGDLTVNDNWFEAGMDSIMAAQLADKINQKFKQKCVVAKDIFTHSSAVLLTEKIQHEINKSRQPRSLQTPKHQSIQTYPLSLQQHEIWNFLQHAPDPAAYHIPIAMQIDGALSKDTFQEALSNIQKRHDVLRCSFHEILGQISQHASKNGTLRLEFSDTYHEEEIASWFKAPFDLSKAPLMRTQLIQLEDEKHLWLVVFHHLICDGFTVTAFIQEVIHAYEGKTLDENPTQYFNYVHWQWENEYYAQSHYLKNYWYHKLENMPVTVPLASETQQPMEARIVSNTLSLDAIKKSVHHLEKNSLSISNFLLASLFESLFAAFNKEKLGIIVFFSGRDNGDFANVFGDTSNDVVITSEGNPNIFTHTQALQNQILSIGDKQHFRLPILNELGLKKPTVSFDFQRSVELNLQSSLQLTMIKTGNVQNHLWGDEPRLLSFKVLLTEDQLKFALKYRADRIDSETAHQLLENWLVNLKNIESSHHFNLLATRKELTFNEASPLQHNAWELLKNHPNGLPYYVPLFKRVSNDIDRERLNAALQKTIQNTPALRIAFKEQNEVLTWHLQPEALASITEIEVDNMVEFIETLLVEPINPEKPPLLMVTLITCNTKNKDPVVFIRLHHLICDAVSAEYFINELEHWYFSPDRPSDSLTQDKIYTERLETEKTQYEKNLYQYAQYIANINNNLRQNQWLPKGEQDPMYSGNVVYHQIPPSVSEKIKSFCQKNQFSRYAFYLHVFCKELMCIEQGNSIYISIVKSNRMSLNDSAKIGYFADNIPIIVKINPDKHLEEQIKTTQMKVIDVVTTYQHSFLLTDMEKIHYRQPQFIFNQYKAESNGKLFLSADDLIYDILERANNQVMLWNYPNPEKLNLLVRSSNHGDLLGLVFNSNFIPTDKANILLERMLKTIRGFI